MSACNISINNFRVQYFIESNYTFKSLSFSKFLFFVFWLQYVSIQEKETEEIGWLLLKKKKKNDLTKGNQMQTSRKEDEEEEENWQHQMLK